MNILDRFRFGLCSTGLSIRYNGAVAIIVLHLLHGVGVFGGDGFTAQASDSVSTKLQLEISVNRQALNASRVQIDSTLTNGSTHSIKILAWNTPFAKQVTGRVFQVERHLDSIKFGDDKIGGGYSGVAYNGLMVKRGPPSEREYLVLEPGEKISNSLDITESYSFVQNRQHRITFDRPINLGNNLFQSLTSNTIEFFY